MKEQLHLGHADAKLIQDCVEAVDRPFLEFWQELLPEDFEAGNRTKELSLEFELSGILRRQQTIAELSKYVPIGGKSVLTSGQATAEPSVHCGGASWCHKGVWDRNRSKSH